MKRDWARILLIAWGAGIFVGSFSSLDFYLTTYGHGGVAEYRGRMAAFDRDFPPGQDYILFNHGAVTPISKEYYDLIQRTKVTSRFVHFPVALPLLVAGLLGCARAMTGKWNPIVRGDDRVRFWLRLFFPNWHDPAVTTLGKVYFLCVFLGLIALSFTPRPDMSEAAFIRLVIILYAAYLFPAVLVTLLIRYAKRVRDRRRAGPQAA